MTPVVVDASAALALVLPDESSGRVQAALAGVDRRTAPVLVPALWWYECTNVLLVAARRGRVPLSAAREALSLLSRLPDETRGAASLIDSVHGFHLATRFDLTAYDAAYLALAETEGARFLSLDVRLVAAAQAIDIPLL